MAHPGEGRLRLYALLAVDSSAGKAEVKRAYLQRAYDAHPDRPGGNEQIMTDVTAAGRILRDDATRRAYDMKGGDSVGWAYSEEVPIPMTQSPPPSDNEEDEHEDEEDENENEEDEEEEEEDEDEEDEEDEEEEEDEDDEGGFDGMGAEDWPRGVSLGVGRAERASRSKLRPAAALLKAAFSTPEAAQKHVVQIRKALREGLLEADQQAINAPAPKRRKKGAKLTNNEQRKAFRRKTAFRKEAGYYTRLFRYAYKVRAVE
jgi:curved DNA-binding protein CbpA